MTQEIQLNDESSVLLYLPLRRSAFEGNTSLTIKGQIKDYVIQLSHCFDKEINIQEMNIQAKRILPQYFFVILLMSAKLFDDVSIFW